MILKNLEGPTILRYDLPTVLPDHVSEASRRQNPELTRRQCRDDDRYVLSETKSLQLTRNRNDIAVSDAADLHKLHERSIYAYIPLGQV